MNFQKLEHFSGSPGIAAQYVLNKLKSGMTALEYWKVWYSVVEESNSYHTG